MNNFHIRWKHPKPYVHLFFVHPFLISWLFIKLGEPSSNLGPLYMEGPNGCRPKSSKFLPIGLLGIVKMGPRALHWGPIQISSHPTWRSVWHRFGAKTLDLSKGNVPRFSLAPITKLGPIWDWPLKWVKGSTLRGSIIGPFAKQGPLCWPKYFAKWVSAQMGWAPNIKYPLKVIDWIVDFMCVIFWFYRCDNFSDLGDFHFENS
jgi:hypothetical protein